jgi:hypothetical protein
MALEHLDSIIAFATVMLGVSLLITVLTQMASALLGLRGTNLRWGITQLIKTICPDNERLADKISESALRHPLISTSTLSKLESKNWMVQRWQLASHISTGELVGILERMAGQTKDVDLRAGMQRMLQAANGEAMGNRTPAGQEAPRRPAAPVDVGGAPTAVQTAPGNLEFWFQSAMDRTAQRFRVHMRIWTVAFALIVAFTLHLDSLQLFSQLSSDAELRAGLATAAKSLSEKAQQAPATGDNKAIIEGLSNQAKEIRADLEKSSFRLIPVPYPGLFSYQGRRHLFGVLFTAALLSLGAPFWFNTLRSLSSLRPLLAKADLDKSPAA